MSGLDCAFHEFLQTRRISIAIIDKHRKFKEYKIIIYCMEQNINVEN